MLRRLPIFLCLAGALGGCIHVTMDPIQVNAVVDVNLKVEREVASLLSDIYGNSATIASTAPAAK